MDEHTNPTAVVEDTTPATENVEETAPAAETTPAENPAPEQPEGTTPAAEPAAEDPQTPVAPFLPVKFRHETRDLTREDAAKYAQLGLLREAEGPMMDDLALMAAAQGKTVAEFIRELKQADEQALRDDKLNITGGDAEAAETLVQAELARRREALNLQAQQEQEAEAAAEKTLTDRLAGEFGELREMFPDLAEWSALPKSVIEDAIKNERNLADAYLRYQHREGANIERNRAAAAAAAAASIGSQADNPPTGEDPAIAAMRRAVRNA